MSGTISPLGTAHPGPEPSKQFTSLVEDAPACGLWPDHLRTCGAGYRRWVIGKAEVDEVREGHREVALGTGWSLARGDMVEPLPGVIVRMVDLEDVHFGVVLVLDGREGDEMGEVLASHSVYYRW